MELFDPKDILILDGLIAKSSRIVISTHINPDGDAAGSSLGLLCYLKGRGKDATVIFPTPLPENLRFMIPEDIEHSILVWEGAMGCFGNVSHDTESCAENGYYENHSGEEACRRAIRSADLLISVDYYSISRSGKVEDELRHFSGEKVLIDHHLSPDRAYYDLTFSTENISSASEAVFWILYTLNKLDGQNNSGKAYGQDCEDSDCKNSDGKNANIGWSFSDKAIGTLLMTGMTTDTNNFANSTLPSTLEMAKILLAAGVDRDGIIDSLYKRYRENRFRLLGYILSQKLTITENGAVVVLLTSEELKRFDIRDGETEGFVNIPLEMEKVRLSIFIREDSNGHFRVSLRSKKGTSANRCSQLHFHGGGHELASGGRLTIPQDASDIDSLLEYAMHNADCFLASGKL